ncbi:MAG: hypothetical protein QHH14_12270 [Clostridiales bacterium]|nr:hypothetical protein [Clostridiales bacterium]
MDGELRRMNPTEGSGGDMVNGDIWHEIHSRFKLKEAKRSIARVLGISVQTVRKVLRQEEPKRYQRRQAECSILKAFEVYIRQRVAAVGFCAQAIFEELRERGYTGSYSTVRRFIHPLREEAQREEGYVFLTKPSKEYAQWYTRIVFYCLWGAGLRSTLAIDIIRCHSSRHCLS